jgi:hypothetical protein
MSLETSAVLGTLSALANTWEPLGVVYTAKGEADWRQSHAFLPVPYRLNDETIRVYVAFCDAKKVGRVGYVDVAADDPTQVLAVSDKPVLDIGDPGAFDDNGVTPMTVFEDEGRLYLFYVGWQLGVTIRYTLFMGLAVSSDGGETFERVSTVPILDRADGELFVRTAAHVLKRAPETPYQMWYIAGDSWIEGQGENQGKKLPTYNLRYLEADCLQAWPRQGQVVMDLNAPDEYGFGRPFVLYEEGRYRMWYSIRAFSKPYSIGYAESLDGRHWTRLDSQLQLPSSEYGWDNQMQCFSAILDVNQQRYLFYNGNNFGETGFGVARLIP